jgi:hypothetical protein
MQFATSNVRRVAAGGHAAYSRAFARREGAVRGPELCTGRVLTRSGELDSLQS